VQLQSIDLPQTILISIKVECRKTGSFLGCNFNPAGEE